MDALLAALAASCWTAGMLIIGWLLHSAARRHRR
jgi:membrane protein DedA with SNARE-associated domain